jgi:competence protein ComEA
MRSRFLLFALAGLFCVGQAIARVNVNTATAEELQTLDGIGPVRAQLIIDYRRQNGPFKNLDDLRKIPELRGAVAEGLKGRIIYRGETKISGGERSAKSDEAKAEKPAASTSLAKPKALPPPKPAAKPLDQPVAPAAPAASKVPRPAAPAIPASRPATEAPKPAVPATPARPAQPATPAAAPARPAMPGATPAKPAVPGAHPAQPAAPAAVANPAPAKPAAPAMPARPAQPAGAN